MPLFPDTEKAPSKLATLSFSAKSLTVPGGSSKQLQVTFQQPTDVDKLRIPVFSGKVVLHGSNGDKFEIPYSGVASDLRKYNPLRSKFPTFSFVPGTVKTVSSKSPMKLAYRLNLPTAEMRFDVGLPALLHIPHFHDLSPTKPPKRSLSLSNAHNIVTNILLYRSSSPVTTAPPTLLTRSPPTPARTLVPSRAQPCGPAAGCHETSRGTLQNQEPRRGMALWRKA